MGTIVLRDMMFFARHGESEAERQTGGRYKINLSFECDILTPGKTDDIADAVDYAAVYRVIALEMNISSNLLENVALRIAQRLKNDFKAINSLCLELYKINPPIEGQIGESGVIINL